MKISQEGLDLLKKLEGYRPIPYKCAAGQMTVGYGHKILPKEKFTQINLEEAETILKNDVSWAEKAINVHLLVFTKELKQNQFDALVCFVFNIGAAAFQNSGVLKALLIRDYGTAVRVWMTWNKIRNSKNILVVSQGLVNRRKAETQLFNS
jgi:lysozyme